MIPFMLSFSIILINSSALSLSVAEKGTASLFNRLSPNLTLRPHERTTSIRVSAFLIVLSDKAEESVIIPILSPSLRYAGLITSFLPVSEKPHPVDKTAKSANKPYNFFITVYV